MYDDEQPTREAGPLTDEDIDASILAPRRRAGGLMGQSSP
jgi:hypothetical protein